MDRDELIRECVRVLKNALFVGSSSGFPADSFLEEAVGRIIAKVRHSDDLEDLLEAVTRDYMLIHQYPYLDEDRSKAMAMEKQLQAALKLIQEANDT